jgi:23S rRNA pseudouridine1911/1915/1917 synthase
MKKTIPISEELIGARVDTFLVSVFPEYSRSFWRKVFATNEVLFNGKPVKPAFILKEGSVSVTVPEPNTRTIDIPIIYEDDDVIVVNKPTGVITHMKGIINEEPSVAEFVRPKTDELSTNNRPGIVHRLDRDTSGVIICAKNQEAKRWLQKQFSTRKVKKAYTALLDGVVLEPRAIIRLPIQRNMRRPQQFWVGPEGKPAETAYEVLEYFPDHTLVDLHPHTGRTHQLRVHMAYLGHPISGDRVYGKGPTKIVPRLFLHARELEITLPSRERKVFSVPLPEDLQAILTQLHGQE